MSKEFRAKSIVLSACRLWSLYLNSSTLNSHGQVGADGGKSAVRAMAGFQTKGWEYQQTAVICTVKVESKHSTAWQRFLPTGPFALLPMNNTYSNIVWTTSPETANALKAMSNEHFVAAANKALIEDFGPKPESKIAEVIGNMVATTPLLGAIGLSAAEQFQDPPRIVECVTERLSFPLSLMHASMYIGHRVALVGDAAHTVHPLAGQGVNLGFGDAASLSRVVQRGVAIGHDIGQVRYHIRNDVDLGVHFLMLAIDFVIVYCKFEFLDTNICITGRLIGRV